MINYRSKLAMWFMATIVMALAAVHGTASAQLTPCPSLSVEIFRYAGTVGFPVTVSLVYSGGADSSTYFGPTVSSITPTGSYTVLTSDSVRVRFGDGVTGAIVLDGHNRSYNYSTNISGKFVYYHLEVIYDERGCPHFYMSVSAEP